MNASAGIVSLDFLNAIPEYLGRHQVRLRRLRPRRILERISETIVDTTGFMPVTREMSAAKRLILETRGGLVKAGFPQKDLAPIAVPCD